MKILKNLSVITSIMAGGLALPLLTSCSDQEPAQVEYHLEDFYSYGDTDNVTTSKPEYSSADGEQEIASIDTKYTPPATVEIEENTKLADQEYTVPQPEDISKKLKDQQEKERSAPPVVTTKQQNHIVGPKETLYSVSRQYNIPILTIISANNLQPPYSLNKGQELVIPKAKFHVVAPKETLYSISRQYGVDMSAISRLNNLQSDVVKQGTKLQIPEQTYETAETEDTAIVEPQTVYASSNSTAIASKNIGYRTPIITTRDSDKPTVATETNINQKVTDTSTQVAKAENKAVNEITITKNEEYISIPKKADAPAEEEVLQAAPVKEVIVSTGKVGKAGFVWPLQGSIAKSFGQHGAEYSDGINIAAARGKSVAAANSGKVVYVGDSMKSYGNLVIVKHDNGLLSAYAHLDKINVNKDQLVKRGQVIGNVGTSGKVDSPQLYFAIRKGKEAVNPMIYLAK